MSADIPEFELTVDERGAHGLDGFAAIHGDVHFSEPDEEALEQQSVAEVVIDDEDGAIHGVH